MAITLPTSPADGDTATQGSVEFKYTASTDKWVGKVSGSTTPIPSKGVITGSAKRDYQIAATAPTTKSVDGGGGALEDGDLWYDQTANALKVWDTGTTAWASIGGTSAGTNPGSATLTSVFSGNAGTQWYDLNQHGAGLYRIIMNDYTNTGIGLEVYIEYITGVSTAVVVLDYANGTPGVNTSSPNMSKYQGLLGIFGGTNFVHSVARYVGSRNPGLPITTIQRITQ